MDSSVGLGKTLYASFGDNKLAQQAVGALLDHGMQAVDVSIVGHQADEAGHRDDPASAKGGVSTTTGRDAASGAVKGAGIGAGVGTIAVLASLFIPGLGLVTGAGALATALAAAAGTAAAGAAAGAVTGYLKDQGVPADVAVQYQSAITNGGSVIALTLPSGGVDLRAAEEVLAKYQAQNIRTF
ncbi:MAG: hypothetical protein M3Z37_09070 [Candidatus Eremiobacteraeota bacterium]|nr:hypothetical protein [Candidatus Eremiobacteraeota bacterium]